MTTPAIKTPPDPSMLLRIAERRGTPTYVYFADIIRDRIKLLRERTARLDARLLYAMKANGHPAILSIMKNENLGIDAVSPAEVLLALRVGFEPDRILFSANNMTDDEMEFAHRQGVLLNVGELSRLDRYGNAHPGSRVCVRLNPRIGAGHHDHVITAGPQSKFGIPVDAAGEIVRVVKRHDLHLVGLHQHIGSGILDTETLWSAIHVLLQAARHFPPVDFINLGGGLGVPYRPGEAGLDFENFDARIVEPLSGYPGRDLPRPAIWFEPGRFLTAEAGVLLVRVNTVKTNPERTFAGVDSGMTHLLRPALYGSYHGIYNLSNPGGKPRSYDVVGNICETGDRFASDRVVQEIREGDVLAILDTGAYGMSMASPSYNLRPVPAEVLVPGENEPGRFVEIGHRQTPAELVSDVLARAVSVRG